MALHLVTGGAGFIGSHLAAGLIAAGHQVRILDNLSTGNRDNLRDIADRIEFQTGDITDDAALAAAMRGVDCVFHCAALASVPRSVVEPLATHLACATGTLQVLNQARLCGVRRVVYSASSSAYGDQPTPRKKESDLPLPLSPYAAAKLAGELYATAAYRTYGLETVSLRYFNVFGPRQDPNGPYAAVIPKFISAIVNRERPTIFGDGKQTRDFTHVANVVAANMRAAEAPGVAGRVFNVGSGEALDLLTLLDKLGAILGAKIEPIFEPARVGDVRDSLADVSAAREVLGYTPQVGIDEGLRQTAAWFQQNAAGR